MKGDDEIRLVQIKPKLGLGHKLHRHIGHKSILRSLLLVLGLYTHVIFFMLEKV